MIVLLTVVAALVIAIVTCGATFLVRDIEAYNYYENAPDYDARVISAANIKKNTSMFFIDEAAVKNRVESAYANVGVINVERKFPDRVSINYVVYDSSFQYLNGAEYYQCFASGRIGGSTSAPMGGYFIIKPRGETSSTLGDYFQGSDGYDFGLVMTIIDYLHSTALNDKQIAERIDFIDFSRDGYVYIRTAAGCSIEIHGTDGDFARLLDDGWSIFADPDPELPVSKATGTIRTYVSRSDPDNPSIKHTYSPTDGESYYRQNYILAD